MPSPKFNRATLEENSIFFFEKKDKYGLLPAHVNSLRDALLDFECTLPARLSFYDEHEHEFEDDETIRSVMDKLFVSDSERASIGRSIKTHRDMKYDAQRLDNGCDREAEWVKFYEKNFLDKLCDEFVITDEDSRRVARTKFYYDNFDVAKERRWTLFNGPGDFRKEYGKSKLAMPIPDWVAYFRVYDLKSSWDRIRNSSSRWPLAKSAKDKIVENFSLATLQELAEHGLQFSVANILRGNRNSSIVLSDLLCYPWLITEYKKKNKDKDDAGVAQCYCQAANAGAASLMLLQTLVRHSTYKTVLPVVTMTTWGPEVRIWICFFDDSIKSYNMVCIWEGNMTRIVHMFELQAILENTHTWAVRVLRPWISHHIDQWKSFCHTGRGREQEESVENDLTDRFGALVLANPLPKVADELLDGDSVQGVKNSELKMLFKEQNSLLLAEMRELLGTQRATSNTERSNKRPPSETRSISTQTDDNLGARPEKGANHYIPGRNQTYTPEGKSDLVNSERLFPESSVPSDVPGDPQNTPGQPSCSNQVHCQSAPSSIFRPLETPVSAGNKGSEMQNEQKERQHSSLPTTNDLLSTTERAQQASGDNLPVFDPDTKIPLFKNPTPPANDTFLPLNHKTRDTSKDSNHSSRRANASTTGDGPATPCLELGSSNPEETTSGQTPSTPVSKHMFNSQPDWDFGTPNKASANARSTSSDSRPRATQPLSSSSGSKILQSIQSPSLRDNPNLSNHQQSNETSPAETPNPPLGSNSIERKRWSPSPFGAQSLSPSSPSPFRLPSSAEARPDSDVVETDPLYSLRDLFRLPQIESSDEIWSSSRAKSPVPRRLRGWLEFDSPLGPKITRCASGPMTGGYDCYPYLTYERGEVLEMFGVRDGWYLARRGIGCDNPKGWVRIVDTAWFDTQRGRSSETTGSRIPTPGPTNGLTEAPELIKTDTHALGKGSPSLAFQRSPATASLETKEASWRNLGLASVAMGDVSIRPKWVECWKTGRRIRIKLPNRPIKERRLSMEFFAHPPRFAYNFTSTALSGSRHEDGPPVRPTDLASFSKQLSTPAAEHGSGTDISADRSQSPPLDERPKVGLFEQSNRGNFNGGLFDGLDTNGWKPSSIPNRDEQRQLCSDSDPSKPTRGEPFRGCPSPSSSQQKGSGPSDASKTPVQASLSDGVKISTPTTPGLFGHSNAFKTPKENSVPDEKQTGIFKIGLLNSDPYTPSKPRLSVDFSSPGWKPIFGSAGTETWGEQSGVRKDMPDKDDVAADEPLQGNGHTKQEAPLQPESCISAEEDWETTDEE
ncbi:hypothetical protein DL770_003741 [Monosporascus sp. CRB-9-2]|nr:hypothetical protein DL770_003741 [Monosporascus sp. CRB-9-2]